MDELKKLAELRDMGIVTKEEFILKKKTIIRAINLSFIFHILTQVIT